MLRNFTQIKHCGAMETETISKNEASPKSQMSRENSYNLFAI